MRSERKRRWDREHRLRSVKNRRVFGGSAPVPEDDIRAMRLLRRLGHTVERIADVTGYSYGTVVNYTKDVERAAES